MLNSKLATPRPKVANRMLRMFCGRRFRIHSVRACKFMTPRARGRRAKGSIYSPASLAATHSYDFPITSLHWRMCKKRKQNRGERGKRQRLFCKLHLRRGERKNLEGYASEREREIEGRTRTRDDMIASRRLHHKQMSERERECAVFNFQKPICRLAGCRYCGLLFPRNAHPASSRLLCDAVALSAP